jgi:alanine racemase
MINSGMYRETWAEVSTEAIRHNIKSFKQRIRPDCQLMAVVKANGYGHGIRTVAIAALQAGADQLGVAILDEAIELRAAGIEAPIMVLGYIPSQGVEAAIRQRIELTVFTEDIASEIVEVCRRIGLEAKVHLKLDTGMSRLGVSSLHEAITLVERLSTCELVKLKGVFTHLACADMEHTSHAEGQFKEFKSMIDALELRGGSTPVKHCCNTAATLRFPLMHLDMVRVGIGIYGHLPSQHLSSHECTLIPAMQLKSRITCIRNIDPGESVSYGGSYVASRRSRIATLPIGYADGLPRVLSNRGFALVRERRVPIVGTICMDQTMLDVTEIPEARAGDVASLFGGSSEDSIQAEDIASWSHSINYEIVCRLGPRVPRIVV